MRAVGVDDDLVATFKAQRVNGQALLALQQVGQREGIPALVRWARSLFGPGVELPPGPLLGFAWALLHRLPRSIRITPRKATAAAAATPSPA